MSKFNRVLRAFEHMTELESKNRDELIELYYQYSPRELDYLIDTDKERERLLSEDLCKLRNEVLFYIDTSTY